MESPINSPRKLAQSQFKKAIRQGANLKELIDMFYEIEEPFVMADYKEGIKINFAYACATGSQIIGENSDLKQYIKLQDF